MKPYSESCDQNKGPILAVLKRLFADQKQLLEIGSGTGQHAAYFPRFLSHLLWQPSDVSENLSGIESWLAEASLGNVAPPIELDVQQSPWPEERFDAVFSANTVHIMGWPEVESMFRGIGQVLIPNGLFALYGPFDYGGQPSSESNARFHIWLQQQNPKSGVRNFEDIVRLAELNHMLLEQDIEMPVNNRILLWRRQ